MPRFYYEDYVPGSVDTFSSRVITRDEIIAFAAEFDPQPMHLDEEAAKASMLGGLAASGWHTCAFLFRMMHDDFIRDSSSMGSPGVEETRWLKPVRPNMRLTLRRAIHDKRVSKSRPDMGLCRMTCELLDERGEPVIRQTSILLLGLRRPEPAR